MPALPRISETEWEVMKVVWTHAPITAAEIIEHLRARNRTWHPKTVRTLLNRLVKKKALGYRRDGRVYLYRPLVAEKDCVAAAAESFLDRVFGGALHPMLAHFVEQRKLTAADLKELQQILNRRS